MKSRAGSLSLELILVIGVSSVIVLAGMGAIRWHLQQAMQQAVLDQEWIDLNTFRRSVELAWDQRCSHILREGKWLEIEVTIDGSDRILERLWILHFDENARLAESVWNRTPAGWVQRITRKDGAAEVTQEKVFRYQGRIQTDAVEGSYVGGAGPHLIRFRFPDAGFRRLRQGFAIEQFW